MLRGTLYHALRIALIYALVASTWVLLSDHILDRLVDERSDYVLIQAWKGGLFVTATALLLFLLVRSALQHQHNETRRYQRLHAELKASRSIQADILEILDDLVWMRDIASGKYLFMSKAVERIYGVKTEAFTRDAGDYWMTCVHPEDRFLLEDKKSLLDSGSWTEFEYRIVRPDGEIRWLRDRTRVLCNADGQPLRYIGIACDITTQRQHAEDIHRLAHYDSLTGLPNRHMLEGLMRSILASARQQGQRVALLYLDISRLKDINATYGHVAGDEVLRRYAMRLHGCLAAGETLTRLGADEFIILVPQLGDDSQATLAGQRFLATLMAPFILTVGEVRINTAIGISIFPDDAETSDALLQKAGLALDDAKLRGPGHIRVYQATMDEAVGERISLLSELHHALAREEIELYYHPQIDLACGRVVGAEALMRWRHPKRGLVSPAQFIPLAEESGLILSLGEWALAEACRQNRAWQQVGLPPMVVAVNISAVQFREGNLRDKTAQALATSGLEARWLELEVTESAIMDGATHMLAALDSLRELGVHLSIDDFGTGYSSLSYLTRFAVNKLKIDQSFVRGALLNERDATIVGIIVQMAKALHLRVVAEGVETVAQAEMLKAHGCDEAQGYLYARPMPASELEAWLRQQHAASADNDGTSV